ncbi:MAG: TIGR02266 family protein [Myxococcota bacterium]
MTSPAAVTSNPPEPVQADARHAIPPGARDAEGTSAGAEDRRHHRRVELETDVSFESDSNFFTGFMEDVSEGGLFLATYQLEPIGTVIETTFHLPDGHIVHARGQVRWIRDPRNDTSDARPGMGIQFDELLPEDRRAIQAFIEARSPLFYEE